MPPPLDTNILIRHLAADYPDHSLRARSLLQDLYTETTTAALTKAVLVETVHVLSSKSLCSLLRPEIARHLSAIIRFRGIKLVRKRRYLRALELYEATPRLSFVDALLVAYAEENAPATVISFDRGFDGVPDVKRLEP